MTVLKTFLQHGAKKWRVAMGKWGKKKFNSQQMVRCGEDREKEIYLWTLALVGKQTLINILT